MTHYKIVNRRKRMLVKTADSLLKLVPGIRSGIHPPWDDMKNIQRILAVRLAYIGDVVMTQPAFSMLRRAFPGARLTLLTSRPAGELMKSDPDLDDVITWNAPWFYPDSPEPPRSTMIRQLRDERFDLGIDFRGDIRNIMHCLYRPGIPRRLSYDSGGGGALLTHVVPWSHLKHKVDYHVDLVRAFGIDDDPSPPVITLHNDETAVMHARLGEWLGTSDSPVVIHPGARLRNKRWPAADFRNLIRELHERGIGPVAIVAHESEQAIVSQCIRGLHGVTDLAGKLNIRELAALLSMSRFLVCNDSAAMHIAAAVSCPVVALFGPSRPRETAPNGMGHRVIEGHCYRKDDCDERHCRLPDTAACIRNIDVMTVVDACEDLWTTHGPPDGGSRS